MSKYYEIVIFTSGTKEYADGILEQIDRNKTIKHRLYRNHCTPHGLSYRKNLNLLGRDLSKVIMIDNNPEYFELTPDNGLPIATWENDVFDHQLFGLMHVLKGIYTAGFEDVRKVVSQIRKMLPEDALKDKNPYMKIDVNNLF
jgi:Dullard-like phosphatase family protein